mgnify:CR=1 FL=1
MHKCVSMHTHVDIPEFNEAECGFKVALELIVVDTRGFCVI